jgi:hypothetical protein
MTDASRFSAGDFLFNAPLYTAYRQRTILGHRELRETVLDVRINPYGQIAMHDDASDLESFLNLDA